jgi:hypothetical protein
MRSEEMVACFAFRTTSSAFEAEMEKVEKEETRSCSAGVRGALGLGGMVGERRGVLKWWCVVAERGRSVLGQLELARGDTVTRDRAVSLLIYLRQRPVHIRRLYAGLDGLEAFSHQSAWMKQASDVPGC